MLGFIKKTVCWIGKDCTDLAFKVVQFVDHNVINGKQDIQSKMMVTMFGLFAEIERDLILKRNRDGLQNARDKGKNLGRPKGNGKSKLDGKEAEIKILLDKNVTKASIAKIMNVSRSNLLYFIDSRALNRTLK
jgi:DNA invertase Pin-like site-specific DNA recombinase